MSSTRIGRSLILPPVAAEPTQEIPTVLLVKGACDARTVDHFAESQFDVAKGVCAKCPVIELCRRYALAHEEHGVWGGLTPMERDSIRGTPLRFSVEQRQDGAMLRQHLRQGLPHALLAELHGVSTRTIERAAATLRRQAA